MRIEIPEFAVVTLIGTSGSGKSTFAAKHFAPTEILSSDVFRGIVSDDEESLEATSDAFEALHSILNIRLRRGLLTVIDATNVQKEARKPIIELANRWHALKVAIFIDTPESVAHARNQDRPNRQFGPQVVRGQHRQFRSALSDVRRERWTKSYVIKPEQMEGIEVVRTPIWSRMPQERGPFDIIGDIHGCWNELEELLTRLGWQLEPELHHPDGRRLIFLGDLVDRGPDPVRVLKFVMQAVGAKVAYAVPGNHDIKLSRALGGRDVPRNHGLAETMELLATESEEFRTEVGEFLEGLVSHFVLDEGKLCVAHAGLREEMQGRGSSSVREFAMYGESTGEIDEFGLPVRYEWAKEYRGRAMVVYGHTPVPEPEWINNTIDIDTGCCFGGKLSALRYPEREIIQVDAREVYADPVRPLGWSAGDLSGQQELDTLLDLQDVVGKRHIEVEGSGRIAIREENAIAALEIMSRFAADPRWLVYLPPTMSPCETSNRDGYLEYPAQALDYYRNVGVSQVVCEEKHMGSRAVVVVGQSPSVATTRFGIEEPSWGIVTTRTGRPFFDDKGLEQTLLARLSEAAAPVFEELKSDWLLLDCELMPWSSKAQGLLRSQYAPVGVAAGASGRFSAEVLREVQSRGIEMAPGWIDSIGSRTDSAQRFVDAYRRYCWSVNGIEDYKLAPFHLLASEGKVHTDRDHVWHMETLAGICHRDAAILLATPYRRVDLNSESDSAAACEWWESLVGAGGEGMVVKPLSFTASRGIKVAQPAIKCRGPEYLRIIYGPEYLEPKNLERLRKRGLARKRSLASREFALGVEAMHRFVRREPLRRVHECVFGVLALESEPVDPRL